MTTPENDAGQAVRSNPLLAIGERLRTQDNRMTSHPMFCLQILVRDTGYDVAYADDDGRCWWSAEQLECVYEEPADTTGWEEFGYKDRWETVMVALTEEGLNEYMRLDGHNVKRRAHNGQTRIYVESFNRCPEMIAVRESLMANTKDQES